MIPRTGSHPAAGVYTDRRDPATLVVAESSFNGGKLVVHFEGVDGREPAEALRGTVLSIDIAERPALEDPDDFYDTDLVGLRVLDPSGLEIGEVLGVLHGAAHDLLQAAATVAPTSSRSSRAIVPAVDVPAGTVTVDAPEGLFEL